MKLHDKVAIVTGASSGIGREVVTLFLNEGASVTAVSRNIGNEFTDYFKGRMELLERLLVVRGDVTKISDTESFVNRSIEEFGRIDILVNSAGITNRCSVLNSTYNDWENVLKTNLTGSFLASRSVIPYMIEKKSGTIVFISSIGAVVGWECEASYQASKGGLVGLMRSIAIDFAPYNIRVNCVCPGLIDAPMFTDWLREANSNETCLRDILQKIPLGRLGSAMEVARAVLFLASEDSSYITGTSLIVDGGYTVV